MRTSRILNPTWENTESRQPEYERWLIRVESGAMLPLKIVLLAVSVLYWMWREHLNPPSTVAFLVFIVYGMMTMAQAWFFWRDRISTSQARATVAVSYAIDFLFITFLVFQSITEYSPSWKFYMLGDFHLFYLLLVMRGFALFRVSEEILLIAALISAAFAGSLIYYMRMDSIIPFEGSIVVLGLIWFVVMAAMVVINLLSQQQAESIRIRERFVKIEGLANLGELTAGVAHEINNPIGIIKAYAEFLKKSSTPDSENFDDYETIRSEAERCEGIVRRMLDFANPGARQIDIIDIGPVVEDAAGFVLDERHQEDGIHLEIQVSDDLPTVSVDKNQIRQAILNVLMNARQVLQKSEQDELRIKIRVNQQKGPRAPIEIRIWNNGPAIEPEIASHAFEPFFTRREGGTGLGLAITQRIIEAHDGSISIAPEPDGGTVCTIVLPIHEID